MIAMLKNASAVGKCLFALSLSAYVFYCQDWRVLAGLVVVLVGLLFASRDLDRMAWLIVVVFVGSLPVLLLLFILGGVERAATWQEGIWLGLGWLSLFALRLLVLALADLLVVKWTTFSDLLLSLRGLRLPGRVVLFLSTVVTMIPNVFSLAMHVVEVQRCRGFAPKKLFNPKNFLPLFVPVFLAQMKRSTDLALSLELRGISGETFTGGPRLRPRVGDAVLAAAAILIWFAGRGI